MVQADIKWQFSGDYFESCNCEVNCPCHFGSPATYDSCDMVLAWHISHGHYGETSLDGLNLAMMARAPKRMSDGDWIVAFYIDERGTEQQQEALRLIISGDAGGGFARRKDLTGTVLGIKSLPITYEVTDQGRWLFVRDALDVEIEAVRAARPEDVVNIVGDRGAGERGHTPLRIAKGVAHTFNDYSLTWEITGKSCFYAQVEMSGP